MASACVNQILDTSSPSWFSPRMSFSHDFAVNQDPTKSPRNGDVDFEFFVRDPTKISSADELFLNGKLVPLQITSINEDNEEEKSGHESHDQFAEEEKECEKIVINEIFEKGNSASPKAPKCSWKEFLGLKRSQNPNIPKSDAKNSKSLKFFRSKSSSSSSSSPMNLPLLKDVDADAELVLNSSSRLSLSSSSSGADHDDLPRLSLDTEKPKMPKLKVTRPKLQKLQKSSRPGVRTGRSATRRAASDSDSRGVSLESPRMNSSGKIVFHGLERSSSSPSSFNGGPRLKARGMERSYSANVRIRPVLNVPVCSLRGSSKSGSVFGFGQLFSSQKKDGASKNQGIRRNGSGSH